MEKRERTQWIVTIIMFLWVPGYIFIDSILHPNHDPLHLIKTVKDFRESNATMQNWFLEESPRFSHYHSYAGFETMDIADREDTDPAEREKMCIAALEKVDHAGVLFAIELKKILISPETNENLKIKKIAWKLDEDMKEIFESL
jgi:hypothetical protein